MPALGQGLSPLGLAGWGVRRQPRAISAGKWLRGSPVLLPNPPSGGGPTACRLLGKTPKMELMERKGIFYLTII